MLSFTVISRPVFGFLNLHQGPPSIICAPNSRCASAYAQSRNPPSVNFMMLPLCTMVKLGLSLSIVYCKALRTRRSVPSRDTGLTPMPEVLGKRILVTPISSCKNLMSFCALGDSASNSIPA